MVNGKQVWHFYAPSTYPTTATATATAAATTIKEHPRITWEEVPQSTNRGANGNTAVILHDPEQAQTIAPAAPAYHNNCTYNYNNTYNYVGVAEQAAAATAAGAEAKAKAETEAKSKAEAEAKAAKAKAEAETKAEAEAIYISEDDFKLDAMLHEQIQALRQLYYFHTVDYGAGDPYGRRYVRN